MVETFWFKLFLMVINISNKWIPIWYIAVAVLFHFLLFSLVSQLFTTVAYNNLLIYLQHWRYKLWHFYSKYVCLFQHLQLLSNFSLLSFFEMKMSKFKMPNLMCVRNVCWSIFIYISKWLRSNRISEQDRKS